MGIGAERVLQLDPQTFQRKKAAERGEVRNTPSERSDASAGASLKATENYNKFKNAHSMKIIINDVCDWSQKATTGELQATGYTSRTNNCVVKIM